MQPLTASHPPSPHGEASVPISTVSPVCMYSASLKCLSTCCFDDEQKKIDDEPDADEMAQIKNKLEVLHEEMQEMP